MDGTWFNTFKTLSIPTENSESRNSTESSSSEDIKPININDAYQNILSLMIECSSYLDNKYGRVLPGSPLLKNNILAHYFINPDRDHVMYGFLLVKVYDELVDSIRKDMSTKRIIHY